MANGNSPGRWALFSYAAAVASFALLSYHQFWGIQYPEFDAIAKIVSHGAKAPSEVFRIFTSPEQRYLLTSVNYRPIGSLILWLISLESGVNLVPYHWLSFLLHAANSVLVFFFARRILKDEGFYSFLAALFFAVHPIHLQTVLFISRLPDMLVAFFTLISLLSLLKWEGGGGKAYRNLSVAACFLAVFSKSTGSLLPVLVFTRHFISLQGKDLRARLLESLKYSLPYFAAVALFLPLMYHSLGRMDGYIGVEGVSWRFNVLNYLLSVNYPTDFLNIRLISNVYAMTEGFGRSMLFLSVLILSAALLSKKLAKDRDLFFLFSWYVLFLVGFEAAQVLVSPWYMYVPLIAYSVLVASTLRSSAVKWAAVMLTLSIIAYSPLLSDYPAPRDAAAITQILLAETAEAVKYMPAGARIYLVNYPEYMILTQKGFPYSMFLVSEGSVQAFLDYVLPAKRIKAYSVTSAKIFSGRGTVKVGMVPQANCVISAENADPKTANIYPSAPWLPDLESRETIAYKTQYGPESEYVVAIFSGKDWSNTYLLVFDGSHVHVREFWKLCG